MFELFDAKNFTPEYLHILLNHLPIEGLMFGILALVLAIIFKSRDARVLSLALVALAGASVWPVVFTGDRGYDKASANADDDGTAWLDAHEERADKVAPIFYVTAVLAVAAILTTNRKPGLSMKLSLAVAFLAVIALCGGTWVAYAGGKIKHTEFRHSPPPPTEPKD